jgi:hypothetical protein
VRLDDCAFVAAWQKCAGAIGLATVAAAAAGSIAIDPNTSAGVVALYVLQLEYIECTLFLCNLSIILLKI